MPTAPTGQPNEFPRGDAGFAAPWTGTPAEHQPTGRSRVSQQASSKPDPEPEDARKVTEEQRQVQEELDHQGGDPDGPGQQQSRHNTAGESTR